MATMTVMYLLVKGLLYCICNQVRMSLIYWKTRSLKKISIGEQDAAQVRKQCTITMLVYRAKLSPSNLRLPYNARFTDNKARLPHFPRSIPAPLSRSVLARAAGARRRHDSRRRAGAAPLLQEGPPRRRRAVPGIHARAHRGGRPCLSLLPHASVAPHPRVPAKKNVASPAREAKQAPLRPLERRTLRPFARQGSETSAASSARQAAEDERSRPASSRRSVPRRSRAPRPLFRPATQPIRV